MAKRGYEYSDAGRGSGTMCETRVFVMHIVGGVEVAETWRVRGDIGFKGWRREGKEYGLQCYKGIKIKVNAFE